MKLLLFDIDGTLLRIRGLGRVCVDNALCAYFGRAVSSDGVSFSGKTDPQIFRELIVREAGDADVALPPILDAYQAEVRARLETLHVHPLPGAVELVGRLSRRRDVLLGLLTGNVEPMAYLKLRHIGLDRHFAFGAFGSDHEDRNGLPAIALGRAAAHTGRPFRPEDTVVIGDTPRDIACARAVGARAVAVATGRFDRAALAMHRPDLLLDSLEDAEVALLG